MKINKKIIEELTSYLKEFNLSEIEYGEGSTKVKVSRTINTSNIAPSEVKKKTSSNRKYWSKRNFSYCGNCISGARTRR